MILTCTHIIVANLQQGGRSYKPERVEADTRRAIAEASDAAMEFAGEVATHV